MNGRVYFIGGFVVGLISGMAIAWYKLNDQYEKLANEELEARRETAAKERKATDKKEEKNVDTKKLHEKPNIMEYAEKLNNEGYVNYSDTEPEDNRGREEPDDEPYVIPPDIYDEGEYEKITLTYYADGVLADETDEEIENADKIVGDFAEHFGEFEEDVVYVRNEMRGTDYEICKDNQTYEEVSGKKPHRVRV